MPSPAQRAETASQLRGEAHALLNESGLFELLSTSFTQPVVTGSAGYDLMVWRDIDIYMAVESERWEEWMAFGHTLATQLDRVGMPLHQAHFINDWIDPHPLGPGLYWGLRFLDARRNRWSVDIWGWDPFDYAVREARDFALRTDLKGCDRDLILRLKTEARAREGYHGVKVTSYDIYEFCIAQAGDSLSALEMWKKRR